MMRIEAKKAGGYVQVPREILLDAGVVEPTPAERDDAERRAAEDRAHAEQRRQVKDAARARLAAITDQPARAVLDLHKDDGHGCCSGCEFGGYEAWPPDWPCATVDVVAKHYGIDPGDLL